MAQLDLGIFDRFGDRWCRYFFEIAIRSSEMSKDPSTKVGCVYVNPATRHVVAMGFNGLPRAVIDDVERYLDRDVKYEIIVHAEANGIAHAANYGISLAGSISFSTFPVCARCASLMIQAGVYEVYWLTVPPDYKTAPKWVASNELAKMMFKEANIAIHEIDRSSFSLTS